MKYPAQRKNARPTIRVFQGQWVADLRGAGLTQNRLVLGPAALSEVEATNLAWERVIYHRGELTAEVKQQDLFASPAPERFAAALDAWKAQHKTKGGGPGALRYVKSVAARVRRVLGAERLEDFGPPGGNARIDAYVAHLAKRGMSGRTVRNLLTCVFQVLRFAVKYGWLRALPARPEQRDLPKKAGPVYRWITEDDFRRLRARIFAGITAAELGRVEGVCGDLEARLYVERRRCWLSWVFYTGVHHYDADNAAGVDLIGLDSAHPRYIRRNHKSSGMVHPKQFRMPEPLLDDLRALEALQGHPIGPGEAFTGGPWENGSRTIQAAARALGLKDGCTPSILRRSYARELLLLGRTVHEVAELMGHVDTRMLRWYADFLVPEDGDAPVWKRKPGAEPGRILPMRGA